MEYDWGKCQSSHICGVLKESCIDIAECHRKVVSGKKVLGAIRYLVDARGVQLHDARVLFKALFVLLLPYGSDTSMWRE